MKNRTWVRIPAAILLWITSNYAFIFPQFPGWWAVPVLCALAANLLPLTASRKNGPRLWLLAYGIECLKLFVICTILSLAAQIPVAFFFDTTLVQWLVSALVCVCVLALTFWIGIICVYCTSLQLGIKWRIIGALCGMVPIAQLIALYNILRITSAELRFEEEKMDLDRARHHDAICKTQYPILMVHGVFFRDSRFFNYWGRIPDALTKNGADIHYGNHPSAASVSDCGEYLTERIREICRQTGAEKVNIIAHSKGGLDCRYAMAFCGAAPYIASLTTINTPHRGCNFADYLLEKVPYTIQNKVARAYNCALSKFGEKNADFMAAVRDLTSSQCIRLDAQMPLPAEVFCQSIGSKLNHASGGKFPLNFSYPLVCHFDGPNDGLVGAQSFAWGEKYTFLQTASPEGISHGDMIDLNRHNLLGFDVREFYVQLVSDLRCRGL